MAVTILTCRSRAVDCRQVAHACSVKVFLERLVTASRLPDTEMLSNCGPSESAIAYVGIGHNPPYWSNTFLDGYEKATHSRTVRI